MSTIVDFLTSVRFKVSEWVALWQEILVFCRAVLFMSLLFWAFWLVRELTENMTCHISIPQYEKGISLKNYEVYFTT